jgi:exonuclease VII small subunit
MAKPSTETLQETLQELVTKYNEAIKVQNECKQQIIAVQAVIQDRTSEDGDTTDSSS